VCKKSTKITNRLEKIQKTVGGGGIDPHCTLDKLYAVYCNLHVVYLLP